MLISAGVVLVVTQKNHEYMESFYAPDNAGTYNFACPFSVDNDQTWTVCNESGSQDGYHPDDAGELTVTT